jgi:quinol monooxygenase YgiN
VVSGTRGFLPGVLAVLALAGAAGLIWFGVTRMLPEEAAEGDYEEEYRDGEYDAGYDEHPPADQGYEARTGYDEQIYAAPPDPAATQVQPPAHARPVVPPQAQPPMTPPAMPGGTRLPTGERPLPGGPPAAPLCGQITVYTLLDGRGEAFDRLAGEAVRAAREIEPDTLIFTCHEVPGAPSQRIVYQLFRDQAAFAEHQRLPHVQRFAAESRPYVAATNVIELNLTAAKVTPLPSLTAQDYQ